VRAAADERYDALRARCPARAEELEAQRISLEDALAQCLVAEANHVGFNHFDLGAGTMAGNIVSPNSASGHLILGFGNSAQAASPLSGSLYLDGGNYQTDATRRPFGGAIFSLGGTAYRLRFSFAAEGLNNPMSTFANGPTTVGPTTSPIEGGTETTTVTTSESGTSSSDGWQLANWLATAEGQVYIGSFTLDVGAGFGRYSLSQRDTSHVETSSDIQQHSDIEGVPGGTVDIATGTDVTTDTDTMTHVLTNLILGRVGLDYNRGHWTFGGDASMQLSLTGVDGGTTVGNSITVHDTVTDVNIPGFPVDHTVTPGSTTTDDSYTPHVIADTTQWRTAIRLHLFYDTETMSLRLAAGPVLGGIGDEFRWNGMPVAGYASALFQATDDITAGANASVFGDEFNLDGLFATTGDFRRFRDYVAVVNELNTSGFIDDQLRQRYLNSLFDNLVETSDGFVISVGMRVDSQSEVSGHGNAGYNYHFSNGLGLGVDVGGDSEDMSLEAGLHFDMLPGDNQLVLRPEFFTQEDELAGERVYGGQLSLGGYFP
jgi:hypothetical protein